jgi:hypothetical protein
MFKCDMYSLLTRCNNSFFCSGDHDMCFPYTGSEDGRDQLYIRLGMNGGHELPIEMLLGTSISLSIFIFPSPSRTLG